MPRLLINHCAEEHECSAAKRMMFTPWTDVPNDGWLDHASTPTPKAHPRTTAVMAPHSYFRACDLRIMFRVLGSAPSSIFLSLSFF